MTTETVTEAGEQANSPGLRAYLPNRQFARALCSGSAVLIGRGWAWITAEGAKEAGARLLYTGIGAYAGVNVAHTMPQIAMPAAMIGWCGAALMLAPSPPPPGRTARPAVNLTKAAPAAADAAADEDQDQEDEVTLDEVVQAARAIAKANGHQGAHLDDIAAELTWTKQELRDFLAGWGVPVSEFKLRFDGRQRVRLGVRVGDLPAGPGEAPSTASAGAGEGAPEDPAGAAVEGLSGAAAPRSPDPAPAPSQGAR